MNVDCKLLSMHTIEFLFFLEAKNNNNFFSKIPSHIKSKFSIFIINYYF